MQYSGSSLLDKQKGSKSLLLNLFLITSAVVFAFCMVRSASAQQNSQPVLVLTSQKQEYLLGTYLEYLEDPKGELTFEQVRSAQYDSKFSTGKQDILNFGTTDSVYWLRLRIHNDAPTAAKWRLELARPTVNTIILYIPEKTTSQYIETVSYTHLRAHETVLDLVCRLLLEKKKNYKPQLKTTKRLDKQALITFQHLTPPTHIQQQNTFY